uniref:Down syndrome cell adhesion molecule n=2 Tax=Neocellia TaxID=44535 RepID=A0A182YKL3_ANOST
MTLPYSVSDNPTQRPTLEPIGSVPPKISGGLLQEMKVKSGQDFAILCLGQSFPMPSFRWYKYIEGTQQKKAVVLDDRVKQVSGTLIIKDAVVDDSGKYLCVVNNSVGGESVETVLTVTAPLAAKIEPRTQTVDFGRPAVFTCKFSGNPIKTVSWMKDGKSLGHSDAVLRIESVKKEDKGMYQCFIRNDQESAQASAELKLGGRFDPPIIREAFPEETRHPGPSVFLKCVAGGNPTPEISWELDGKKITNSERYQVGQYVTVNGDVVSHLNITSIHSNDGGLYKCMASSKVGVAEHSAKLNVYGLPYVRTMEKKAIVAGETLIVTCPVAGYPIESIVWERDNRQLPINRKQKVFPNGTLIIENVERNSDQATYTCVAKNSEGYTARGTLEVQVMVLPQIVPFGFGEEQINQFDMVSTMCTVNKGDMPIEIGWEFTPTFPSLGKPRKLYTNDGVLISRTSTRISTLSIDSIVPFDFGEDAVFAMDMVSATCTVNKGDLPIDIVWLLNGHKIYSNDGILISRPSPRLSTLSIESVRDRHSGNYSCIAMNHAGSMEHVTQLLVNGVCNVAKTDAVLPQIVPFDFGSEDIFSLDTVSVSCTVSKGDSPVYIRWQFNGNHLTTNNGVLISRQTQRTSFLTIESVRDRHTGNYSCIAENPAGHAIHTASLFVNVLPHMLPVEFGSDIIFLNDMVTSSCTVNKGDFPIDIFWKFNDRRIASEDGITVSRTNQRMSVLTIEAVRDQHSVFPFDFGEEPVDMMNTVSINCVVSKGDTPIMIEWLFNGNRVTTNDGINIMKSGQKISILSIESVQSRHAGNYTCVARNKAGESQHTSELKVIAVPQIMPFEFGEDPFDSSSTVSVQCVVTKGDVPIDIGWMFNGRRISSNDGITVSKLGQKMSTLYIESIRSRHAGNYTCRASNAAGSVEHSSELKVIVVPIILPFEFGEEAFDSGSTASVSCIVTKGDTPIDISWMFNGRRITLDEGILITKGGGKIIIPLILPFEFGEEAFDTGNTASVSCIITKGDVPIDIGWSFNGRRLAANDAVMITNSGPRISILSIDAVDSRHAGNYTCHASNRAGSTKHTAELQVMVVPIIFPFEFGDEAYDTGSTVSVSCIVTKGDAPIDISWMFNGRRLSSSDAVLINRSGNKISILSIESVLSKQAAIPIILPFEFGEEPFDTGSTASVSCIVTKGDTPIDISWLYNGRRIATNDGVLIMRSGHKASMLTIELVQSRHAGNYTCHAANRAGEVTHTSLLQVMVKPLIMPFEFGEEPFDMLTTSTVSCAVIKGDAPIEINWMFNGETVDSGDGVTVTKSGPKMSILFIDSVQPRHAGRYTCVARNKAGFVEHSSELKVIVLPVLLPFEFGDEPADVLSTTMVSCAVAKGDTPLEIEWLFEGRKIEASNEISIMKNGQKIIPPILLPFDFGEEPADVQSTTTVSCAVAKGDPPIEINWMFNGSKLFTSDGILITKSGQKISFLSIESVQARHAGNYTCVARNRAGFAEHTSELRVIVPPILLPFDFGEEPADVQSTTSVTCAVAKGDPPIEINWMFNGSKLFTSDGILITKSGQKLSFLSFESVQARHAVPPILLPFDFGEEPADVQSTTSVNCAVAKGDPPIEINWMFNGSKLFTSDGILITKSGQKISFLSIESVQARHAGNYTCVAKNRAGFAEHTSELKVMVPPILLPFEFGEEPSDTYSTTTVSCAVAKGDTPIEINWMFNGSKIFSNDGITITKSGQKMSLLYIESVQARHAGNYTCVARNKAGFVEHTSELKVIVTPIIMPFEFGDEPFDIYSTTTVSCAVTKGDSPIEIIWLFNDYRLRTSDGVLITSNGQKISFLSIESVQPRHAGNYTCIAKNPAGQAQHSSELKVMVLPIIMPFDFGEDPFDIYSTTTVTCAVTKGDSPIEISWYFNSYRLHTNDGVLITPGGQRVSMLSIESVQPRHAGNYTCIAKNPAGSAQHSAELTVMVWPIILPFEFGEEPFDIYSATTVSCAVTKGDLPITIAWLFNDRQIHSGDVLPIIHPFEFGEEPFDIYSAVTITCTVTKGDLPISIGWSFNKQALVSGESITITKSGQRSSLLSIESVHPWHAGNYTCAAQNAAGTVEHTSELVVIVVPYIMPFEFGDEPFDTSAMTTVSCAVTKGDMPIEIVWSFNGQPLYTGDDKGVIITKSGHRVSMLTIESVSSQHAGNYTCLARNKAGEVRHISQLKVIVPPSITPFSFGEDPLNSGESTAVQCMVFKGDAPLEIRWYMNGNQLPTNENGVIIGRVSERLSSLSIDPIGYFNRGTYECRVKNRAGEAFQSAELVINVVPTIMQFSFGEEILNTGDSVAVNCMVVKGDSPLEIRWYLNNVPVSSENEGIVVVKLSEKLSSLSINAIEPQHRGLYECRLSSFVPVLLHTIKNFLVSFVAEALPVINPFHFEDHVDAEESVQVTCHASKGDLPIEISWLFDGRPIRISSNIEITSIGKRSSSLSIPSVGAAHSGVYTCTAKNVAGSRNQSAELFVKVAPKIFPFSFGEDPSYIDSFVTVQCAATMGDLPMFLEWLHDGELVSKSNDYGISIAHSGRRVSTLTIESIRDHHAGNYTCRARNQAGVAEQSAQLIINVPPKIFPFSFGDDPMNEGDSGSVQCNVPSGDLPIGIKWYFNGAVIEDPATTITNIGKRAKVLTIDSVDARHAGNYTCEASNLADVVHYSASLVVNVPPKIVPFSFGEETMNSGDSGSVQCNVLSGDFPLSIRWYFNGYLIDDHTVTITSIGKRLSVLNIDSVHGRHAGNYTCEAQNKADTVSFTTELLVNVPPKIAPFTFGDEPLNYGDSALIYCSITSGDFPIKIEWYLNDDPVDQLDPFYNINQADFGKKAKALSIDGVNERHVGNYTCRATNLAETATFSAILNVNAPPKIAPFVFGEDALNYGDSASVQCSVISGDMPIMIEWLFNNASIAKAPFSESVNIADFGKRTKALAIDGVDERYAGNYTCRATNRASSTYHTAELIVNVPPKILPFSFGADPMNYGESASIQCSVISGDFPMTIEWLYDGHAISTIDSLHGITAMAVGKRAKALSIDGITGSHAGNYTCLVTNDAGVAEHTEQLIVNVPPKISLINTGENPTFVDEFFQLICTVVHGDLPVDFVWLYNGEVNLHSKHIPGVRIETRKRGSTLSIEAGSNAKVECKADGFPKPQVTWKKAVGDTPGEYKDLRSNDSSIRVEEGSLFIQNIQKSNEGYYLCEAINGIGSGLSAVTLITVQAPPEFVEKLRNQTARRGEPSVLQCEAKGEKPIGILWNMNNIRLDPKSDNRYTIREEILTNGVTSSLSIKRTERSDSALFTCMATNAFGSDDTSINMIIQEPPEMPYALKVLDKSGRTVQLSWAKPYDGNSPLKRYIIEFKRSRGSWENDIDRVIVPGDTNEAQVQKLSPATTYNIRIVAENEIGVSDPSDVVTIITAEEAPSGKPQAIKVEAINQSTLRVSWKAPPRAEWNGDILGYYVGYKQSSVNTLYVYETVNYSPEGGEGKEHSLEINNLKTYTQYSIVIQAFNKVGAGPMSDEEKQYTAEGTPDQPPSDTMCTTLTSQTIRVSWVSPPLESANGVIKGYKVVYAPSDLWNNDKNKDYKKTASSDTVLHGLKKYTNYTMQVLATTSGGDGVRSAPIHCQTEQDVPEAPTAVKALVMSEGSILVSWQPPAQPNGLILQYTVYIKSGDQEPKSYKVPSFQINYEASGLEKNQKYEFWVTASTTIGEGQSSKTLSAMPSDKVPAKIASFDDKFTATFKEDAKLPCLAVGSPTPDITWKIKGVEFVPNERIRQLPEGSLFIKDVIRQDAGDYTCTAENSIAKDSITHRLIVLAPPQSPQLTLTATTTDSLSVKLKPHESDTAPLQGYTLHYKPEFGEWETIDVALEAPKYTIEKLYCGSRYQVYATAYNTIGAGEPSDILNTRTKGSKPLLPEKSRFIEVSSNSITLHLPAWKDGGCRMSHFVVEHKKKYVLKKDQIDWNQISNNVKPGGNFVVLDLEPATWYNLRVTAHNNAGFTVAEYEFATLTITGGTVAPSFGSVQPGTIYPPWIPHWIDLNVMVPLIATVIVVAVGVLVICVAISRRRDDDPRCGPKDVYYDVVYNQSMGPAGAATLDKRRPDIRDELGYIAPPNRKLPPVPGSNYNTCDRVKRGTVISMEDEICPYATFHLLGFREEMDPTKAMNFQTFPHQNGMGGPGHMGTMGSSMAMQVPSHVHSRSGSQSMPRQNRYARKNSQGGQSSIYTPAPEYDDPANCAEEDQYRRYTRINSQGGSLYCGPGPEYDDPANCAPEDDQYGSQYGGNYGTPYEHYGSRGSVGRRSVGSPEPPPPPPRNHDTSNSSFNDSKESNEISEAECDRDNGPRGNYGGE